MATEEDLKKAEDASVEDDAGTSSDAVGATPEDRVEADSGSDEDAREDEADDADAPTELGYLRYVYSAYMALALLSAFLLAKIGHAAWYRLGQWKVELGEPQDEILFPLAGVLGVLIAVYYWRKREARQYANEVAEELSKVTWPGRKEVTNSTTVVVIATLFATLFFALMDRFWGFVTDKFYSF